MLLFNEVKFRKYANAARYAAEYLAAATAITRDTAASVQHPGAAYTGISTAWGTTACLEVRHSFS